MIGDLLSGCGLAQALLQARGAGAAVALRGLAHLQRGEHTDAEATLREALGLDTRLAPAAGLLAWTLAAGGRVEEAEIWMTRAAKLAPRRAWPYVLQGILLKSWNRNESACAALRRAETRNAPAEVVRLRRSWQAEMGL